MDLSIIIPAYNETERLPASLRQIRTFLTSRPWNVEIIVVDDGSSDGTADAARAVDPTVRVIRHEQNRGKGAAVRTGMLAARGEWRYLCDADLSTPITELDHLLSYRDRADVILGSRRAAGAKIGKYQARWKVWLGQLGNLGIQLLVAPGIKDTQCGFKLWHQRTMRVFSLQQNNRWGYDFEDIYLARRAAWRIVEVPVVWNNDDRSKVRPLDYFTTLYELLTIHFHRWRGDYRSLRTPL
ncbi:MAG: glycosyltransferase family 2 protein [Candidatus Kerfeldbacteria bacterium]|nr:glycosyltransferase family 2 protein [Candidatus Kerfeldbacteria bacterium]